MAQSDVFGHIRTPAVLADRRKIVPTMSYLRQMRDVQCSNLLHSSHLLQHYNTSGIILNTAGQKFGDIRFKTGYYRGVLPYMLFPVCV